VNANSRWVKSFDGTEAVDKGLRFSFRYLFTDVTTEALTMLLIQPEIERFVREQPAIKGQHDLRGFSTDKVIRTSLSHRSMLDSIESNDLLVFHLHSML
jgi:hypothetical protein